MFRVPPLAFHAGAVTISAHFVLETLAYAFGFSMYNRDRRRLGDVLPKPDRNSIIAAAIVGGALGSRLLAALEEPSAVLHDLQRFFLAGKTIVGGLLGATIAVEWTKRRMGITSRTGDLFAIPIALAIAIGRLGCFLGGMADQTYGLPTKLPWGVDFGDGVARHPTQLYEAVFLAVLAWVLIKVRPKLPQGGALFRAFLLTYLLWRLLIDFLKPGAMLAGLSSIQWACLLALLFYARDSAIILGVRSKPDG